MNPSRWLIAQFAEQDLTMGPEEPIEFKNATLTVSRHPKDNTVIATLSAEMFSGERFDGDISETSIECDDETVPIENFLDKPNNMMSIECATYIQTPDPKVFLCRGTFDSQELVFNVTMHK